MANESPLIHLGWVIAAADYRNSTRSGTTHAGPSGSAQFMAVQLSTTVDLQVALSTAAGAPVVGLLQNKPNALEAADIGILGVSKAVAGSTTIQFGQLLMADSSGCLIPFTTTTVPQTAFARALEDAGTVGQIFSALLLGPSVNRA